MPLYNNEEDWKENMLRMKMSMFQLEMQMIEDSDKELIPDHKQSQTLKYNKQTINNSDIKGSSY